ncbi:hypothetical protein R3P38DRAFT_3189734 [Favolaschia claudopus]|uniref:F-box domain-containing protein n=1 Tax=Favolaschia claudopus TaxID=2862362 RepID=A0AAW0BPL9_9AGAR
MPPSTKNKKNRKPTNPIVTRQGTVFPVELVAKILLLVCGSVLVNAVHFEHMRTILSHGSSLFFRIINRDFRFWSVLHVDRTTTKGHILRAIDRAHGNRLHLVISINSRGSPLISFRKRFPYIHPTLELHADAFHTITVEGRIVPGLDEILHWLKTTGSRNVDTLNLGLASSIRGLERDGVELLEHSSLTTFTVNQDLYTPPDHHLETIRRWRVSDIASSSRLPWDRLQSALVECTNLTHLVLFHVSLVHPMFAGLPTARCSLPCLTHLSIECDARRLDDLQAHPLALIEAPVLRVLHFAGSPLQMEFLALSDPETDNDSVRNIEVLAIEGCVGSALTLRDILQAYPHLRVFDACGVEEDVFGLLAESMALLRSSMCSQLVELHFGARFDEEALFQVLGVRGGIRAFSRTCVASYHDGVEVSGLPSRASYVLVGSKAEQTKYTPRPTLGMDY